MCIIVPISFCKLFSNKLKIENILQVGKGEKLTPLMIAAKTNNKEFVEILVQKHADPDVVVKVSIDGSKEEGSRYERIQMIEEEGSRYRSRQMKKDQEYENYTALIYAIEAGSYQTLPQLYKVTNTYLKLSFQKEWEKYESCFQKLKTAIKAHSLNEITY